MRGAEQGAMLHRIFCFEVEYSVMTDTQWTFKASI